MSDPADIVRKIFINGEGELRSGWRVLVFFISFLTAAVLLNGVVVLLVAIFPSLSFLTRSVSLAAEHFSSRDLIALYLGQLINLAAALAASWFCARLLERRSLASIGYKLHRGWLRDFSLGSLLGGLSLTLAVAIAAAVGAAKFEINSSRDAPLALGFVILFFFFLIAGAFEELFFRGFMFQALLHNTSPLAAIAITSVLFGLAHFDNNNATIYSTINTILAGAWLGVAYLMTRSLWLATALHYSWNFVMIFVFGLPVSGFLTFNQFAWLRGTSQSPEWVSGGAYGPEGGAAATLVLIFSTLVILKSRLSKSSEEMLAATRHGKPDTSLISISPDKQAEG